MSVEQCSELIGQYEATDQGKVEGLMSIDGEIELFWGADNLTLQPPTMQGSLISYWDQRTTCLT